MSPPPRTRRRLLAGLATASAVGLAGCLGAVDDLTSHEASPATVSESAAEDAGYGLEDHRKVTEEEPVAGETVEFRNHHVEYTRSTELPAIGEVVAGVFTTVTSPAVSPLGRNVNPIAEMDPEDIGAYADEEYPELSVEGDPVEERTVDSLEPTTVTTVPGTVEIEGVDVDAFVDVTRLEHEGDHVVAVGVYPGDVPGSGDRIETMFEGIEHGG